MLSPQEKLEALKRIGLMPRDKNESDNSKESHDGRGVSERAQTRKSLNCRNDETPITQSVGKKPISESHLTEGR